MKYRKFLPRLYAVLSYFLWNVLENFFSIWNISKGELGIMLLELGANNMTQQITLHKTNHQGRRN